VDALNAIAVVTALAALIWGVLERKSRIRANLADARESNGNYVASLANAAHELVVTYRTEVRELRTRLARLEQKLEIFGCAKTDCPARVSLQVKKSS
jgi:hypothetical protein